MDGVVLTKSGVNTMRRVMIKGQPKRPQATTKQKNTQASATATPDTHSAVDTAPPSVYTPVGFEHSPSSLSLNSMTLIYSVKGIIIITE